MRYGPKVCRKSFKKVFQCHYILEQMAVFVVRQAVCCDKNGMDGPANAASLTERPNPSFHIFKILGFHRVVAIIKLHLANINHFVGTLNDKVDLRLFLRIGRCRPRIHLREDTRNAKAFLNLPMVVQAQLLKGKSSPSVVLPRPDLILPKRFV